MDARPVASAANVNPSESIHRKTQSHLNPLESHSCTIEQYKIFRITFLRKTGEGVPHSPLPHHSVTLVTSLSNRGLTNVSRNAGPCHRGAGPRRLPAHRKPRPQSPSHPRSRTHRHRHHRQ